MSDVTNLILAFSILEDEPRRIADVNAWLTDHEEGQHLLEIAGYGGHKAFEVPTYAAAFNYLDLEGFLAHLRAVPWEEREHVRVIVAEQEDETYRMIVLAEEST